MSDSDLGRTSFIKKRYVQVFIIAMIALIVGIVIPSLIPFIPIVEYGDPGYEDYVLLLSRLSSLTMLFQNLGIILFTFSAFMGAITDRLLSNEVRRGLIIASGIGVVALIIFNRMVLYFF
ncbi:MAG: hypothetical protein ACFFD5_06555 [Candidatus Thorarchaeota archaeon]